MDNDTIDNVQESEEETGKCEKVCSTRRRISKKSKTYTGSKRCQCMDCGKTFTRKSSLIVHQRIHTGEKLFMCSECGKRFGLKSSMVRHLRTHTPKTLKICPDCGKCFSRYSSLSQHQKVHRKEKLFRCLYCEKSFSLVSQLLVHQRSHKRRPLPEKADFEENVNKMDNLSTQKTFVCPKCGKYFKERRSFMRHQRIHKESATTVPTNRNDRIAHDNPFNVNDDCTVPQSLYTINSADQIKNWSLYAKTKSHDIEKRVLCIDCGKSFTRKSSLIVHQRIHTGEKLFMCSECGKRFGLKSSMVRHMRTHSTKVLFQQQKVQRTEKRYKCLQRQKSFSRASQLVAQERNHKSEICYPKSEPDDSDFLNKENDHLKDKNAEKPHVCLECGKCFRRNTVLVRHQKMHKGNGYRNKTQNTVFDSITESGSNRFTSKPVSKEDIEAPKREQPDVTENSNPAIGKNSYFVIKYGDDTDCKTGSAIKSFLCIDCGKCFTRKSSLIVHQRIHTGEKLFMCTDCGKRFSLKSSLVRHMRTHSPKILNICSDCGKCFSRYSSLFQHQKVHRREKSYKCPQCEKSFSRASQLLIHRRTHKAESYPKPDTEEDKDLRNGMNHCVIDNCAEEPHVCLECGKCFAEQHLLIRHQSAHIGNNESFNYTDLELDANSNVPHLEAEGDCRSSPEIGLKKQESEKVVKREWAIDNSLCKPRLSSSRRPYHCTQCGKTFTRKSSLIVHHRTHTGEKHFMCTECGKQFGFKSSLVRHLRTHTGQMLNICSECGIYFSRYCDLLLHLENHKGDLRYTRNALSKAEAREEQCQLNTQQKDSVTVSSMKKQESGLQQKDQQPYVTGSLLPAASSLNDYLDPHCEEKIQEELLNIKQETSDNLSSDGEPTMRQKNEDECTRPSSLNFGNEPNHSESFTKAETRHNSEQPITNLLNNHTLEGDIWDGSDQILKRTQEKEKRFLCSECGKNFTRKSSLIVHQRIHTGEKLFMCSECGKRFGLKSSMVRHMRTHSTENYKCTVCGKTFRDYSKFLEHQTSHTAELPYTEPQLSEHLV